MTQISQGHVMLAPSKNYIELRGAALLADPTAPAAFAGGSAVGAASYFEAHFA